jgi:hypothetical protein
MILPRGLSISAKNHQTGSFHRNAPRSAASVSVRDIRNFHRLRVNARELVGAELREKRNSVRVHGYPIGQRVCRRQVYQLYVARFRHQRDDRRTMEEPQLRGTGVKSVLCNALRREMSRGTISRRIFRPNALWEVNVNPSFRA